MFIILLLFLGYRGVLCDTTCPEGTYGENCSNECQCNNGAECSPESGKCLCPPGWRGQQCDLPCEKSFYGENCKNECQCKNDAACDTFDGKYRINVKMHLIGFNLILIEKLIIKTKF